MCRKDEFCPTIRVRLRACRVWESVCEREWGRVCGADLKILPCVCVCVSDTEHGTDVCLCMQKCICRQKGRLLLSSLKHLSFMFELCHTTLHIHRQNMTISNVYLSHFQHSILLNRHMFVRCCEMWALDREDWDITKAKWILWYEDVWFELKALRPRHSVWVSSDSQGCHSCVLSLEVTSSNTMSEH